MKERQGIERDLNEIRFGFIMCALIFITILFYWFGETVYKRAYTQGFHDGMITTIEQYETPENLTE